jgi:hypothetical protein
MSWLQANARVAKNKLHPAVKKAAAKWGMESGWVVWHRRPCTPQELWQSDQHTVLLTGGDCSLPGANMQEIHSDIKQAGNLPQKDMHTTSQKTCNVHPWDDPDRANTQWRSLDTGWLGTYCPCQLGWPSKICEATQQDQVVLAQRLIRSPACEFRAKRTTTNNVERASVTLTDA